MKELSLLILLLGIKAGSLAQSFESDLDSLAHLISAASNDEQQLELLWDAAYLASDEDVAKVNDFTSVLLDHVLIAERSEDWHEALRIQSDADRWIGHYVKAIEGFNTCYSYFKTRQDTSKLIFCAKHLGSMNTFMGYHEKAQEYFLEIYDLQLKRGDKSDIAGALNGLAILYNNTGQSEKAVSKYCEALKLYQEASDTMGQANVHANLGMVLIDFEEYEEAEYHLKMQGKLDTLLGTLWGLGFHFDFMGSLYDAQGRTEEAYSWHVRALELRETLPSVYNINESRASVAESQYKLGNYDGAVTTAQAMFDYQDVTQSLSHQERAYSVISRSYEALGDWEQALRYHKLYKATTDSILNDEILANVTENDAKFELLKHRSEAEVLAAENKASKVIIDQKSRTIMIAGTALVLLAIASLVLLLLRRKNLLQKKELVKTLDDKDTLLREIHHRVKNNLQVVSSLLSLQGRTIDDEVALKAINEGKNRIRTMALIHQDLYQNENLTGVNVNDYLNKLCTELFETYNVSADRIRLGLDLRVQDVDVDTLVPLGLIINELLTNALKYAFPEERPGTLEVKLYEAEEKLRLVVQDDGIGFTPAEDKSNTFGKKLIRTLAKQLRAEVFSTCQNGTRVEMAISNYKVS